MPQPRFAIVVALEREVRPLVRGWRRRKVAASLNGAAQRWVVFESDTACLVIGGIGAKAAASASRAVLDQSQASVLVSAGSAGALKPGLRVGEVFRPATVIDAATGARFASPGGAGILVTMGSILGPREKEEVASRFAAEAVDMEAAAVAAVAQERGVAFLAIKAISDELDFTLPPMGQFVDDEGEFHSGRFLAYLALRPGWWGAVRRMASSSARAASALCAAIESLEADVKDGR